MSEEVNIDRIDYSTLNLRELRKLKLYRLPKGNHLSEIHGNTSSAPGAPTNFVQDVYNAYGNSLKHGPEKVIADPQRPGEYRVINDDTDMSALWIPVPMNSPRFISWEIEMYRHHAHCYYNDDPNDHLFIWPIPMYVLQKVAYEEDTRENTREPRILWQPSLLGTIKIEDGKVLSGGDITGIQWSYQFNPRLYTSAEDDWIQYIESKRHLAEPENHLTVRYIRDWYPEYRPYYRFIVEPPEGSGLPWWTLCHSADIADGLPVDELSASDIFSLGTRFQEYTVNPAEEGTLYEPVTPTVAQLMDVLGIKGHVDLVDGEYNEKDPNATNWEAVYTFGRKKLVLPYYMGSAHHEEPAIDAILGQCLNDMASSPTEFEEYCSEFGYDSNSIADLRNFQRAMKIFKKIKSFLGEHLDAFIEAD